MKKHKLFIAASMAANLMLATVVTSCGDEDDPANMAPTVSTPIQDITLTEGFGLSTVDLSNVFEDEDGDELTLSASSANENVVTVAISSTTLTITEVSAGTSTISITASDGNEGTVSTSFNVVVNEDQTPDNTSPTVTTPLSDLTLTEGFGSELVDLPPSFADEETTLLMFSAVSSDQNVISVAIDKGSLTITEVGTGTSTVTVTATDEGNLSVSDDFVVTVEEGNSTGTCSNDNSISTERWQCDETPNANTYSESYSETIRTITTNGLPTHDYRNQIPDKVSELNSDTKTFTVALNPTVANTITSILQNDNHPKRKFGVALNGVALDPAPAEPFIFEDTETGEYNWDWVMEPNNNKQDVGLDCATAHVQPDGTYHYHGDPVVYADQLLDGLGSGTTTPSSAVQIGWAADGFPVLYKYGPDANGTFKLLESSYQLKSGDRTGDGVSEPCGEYNGKYTNDYEYVQGAGDLDECNGISSTINIGNYTYDYFYVITDAFPVISRCLAGTPDDSFNLGN